MRQIVSLLALFGFYDFSASYEPILIIFGLGKKGRQALHLSFKILRIERKPLKIESKTCRKPTFTTEILIMRISVVNVGFLHVLLSIFKGFRSILKILKLRCRACLPFFPSPKIIRIGSASSENE